MDGSHFDAISRTLVADHSRRGVTRLLASFLLGGAGALGAVGATAAKRKRRKKHRPRPRVSCPAGQRLCGGSCIRNSLCCDAIDCASGQTCCGGVCADLQTSPFHCGACGKGCPVNETCTAGACTCQGEPTQPPYTCCRPGN